MITYKVIKSYDIFEKGDVFTRNNDGTYTCKVTESDERGRKCTTSVTISKNYMLEAIGQGIVIIENDNVKSADTKSPVIDRTLAELEKLANQYQEDMESTQVKAQLGKISKMQEAEAITVLSNLLKLTNHIKSVMTCKD